MNTKDCILITGVSGFIGGALLESLAARHDVVGLCRSRLRDRAPQPPVARGEFSSFEDLRQLDEYPITGLVHLAAVTGGCSEEDGLAVNVQGTRRLLRYLIDRGCRKFVMASSVAAAGCLHADFWPLQLPISDAHPCLARDAYGFSKAMMEELTKYFQRAHEETDFINLRLGAVTDDATWNPASITAGTPLDAPFVELARVMLSDVLQALTLAIEAPLQPGARTYNVVGPDSCCDDPIPAILRAYNCDRAAALDMSWYEQPGHAYDALYTMDKIKNDLGFVPCRTTRRKR